MEELVKREKKRLKWIHKSILLAIADMIIVAVSYYMALLLRFDFVYSSIPSEYFEGYLWSMPYWMASTLVTFYICRLYHSIWRLASVAELRMILTAYTVLIPVHLAGSFFMHLHMPKSYYFIGFIIAFCLTTALRFSYRVARFYVSRMGTPDAKNDRIMIIGAGSAGQILIKELINSQKLHTRVCCVIDDNPNKKGRMLEGVPIVGNRYDIPQMVRKYEVNHIIYAIPATTGKNMKVILNICKDTGCRMQTVPGVYQLVNGEVSVSKLRNVEISDLLGRAQVKVNLEEILGYVQGKVVMVTGGGGSIGSEICRQLAAHGVKQLIIFDIYENNAYEIQQELKRKYPELDLVTLIGSVRNTHRINSIMEEYRPEVVYHAAAHKHVPLMEDSPNEAIKNNVLGTYKTASAAGKHHVKKFVLISTDKAVNPTNIMGASKRMCEMIVQTLDHYYPTEFVAVRFGNVLGSNGSVIPLFKKQIAEGGPITVTHPDIIRYFMTIPEAVSLVLQAGAYAKGGEIFILDMGEPVKIADLAKNLIRLSGLRVGEDIEIKYTGLRPGEKLYEELLMDEEGMQDTDNQLIHIGKPIELDEQLFMQQLAKLKEAANKDSDTIRRMVKEIVPTYQMKKVEE